jgi:hypothetical protein
MLLTQPSVCSSTYVGWDILWVKCVVSVAGAVAGWRQVCLLSSKRFLYICRGSPLPVCGQQYSIPRGTKGKEVAGKGPRPQTLRRTTVLAAGARLETTLRWACWCYNWEASRRYPLAIEWSCWLGPICRRRRRCKSRISWLVMATVVVVINY